MNAKENGAQPAYAAPAVFGPGEAVPQQRGLTKREAFAMAAMQGLLANRGEGDSLPKMTGPQYCIEWADQLLAELAKP